MHQGVLAEVNSSNFRCLLRGELSAEQTTVSRQQMAALLFSHTRQKRQAQLDRLCFRHSRTP